MQFVEQEFRGLQVAACQPGDLAEREDPHQRAKDQNQAAMVATVDASSAREVWSMALRRAALVSLSTRTPSPASSIRTIFNLSPPVDTTGCH